MPTSILKGRIKINYLIKSYMHWKFSAEMLIITVIVKWIWKIVLGTLCNGIIINQYSPPAHLCFAEYGDGKQVTYVTVWAKTRHVRTQTEIHFIAPAYSYTK